MASIREWDLCGLKIKEGDDIDLAAFEAAISLTSSSIIDVVEIKPENILLIDDYVSAFDDEVVAVTLEDGKLVARKERQEIRNSIWDGQSLLCKSLFYDKYSRYGMLLLRNQFFKTCGFNTDIQRWFADNGITKVSQLNGTTLADDVSQIKMITTPSSVKYLKFGSFNQWLENIDSLFGVVKHDKPTYYFQGRMVQSHYQLLNSLQLSYDDMLALLKPSLDYVDLVKTNPTVLRHHIKYSYHDPEDLEYRSKNDVVFGLMGLNEDFTRTRIYQDFKKDLIKSMIKNLRRGHVLINGTYATLFGNGLEMLKSSIGTFDGKPEIASGSVYCKRFGDNQTILGSRSPHINAGNILLTANTYLPEFDRYFNLTNEIVCVNSIENNLQQRFCGADFDGDTALLTDNSMLIERASQNYDKFLVPTSFVEASKTKRQYTAAQKSDLDIKTSVNKIGEIVNLSQELNSKLWHNVYKGETIEQNMDLYYDICKLAVLSGVEIDKAKREVLVDSRKEIESLKEKYNTSAWTTKQGKPIKPMFFKMITTENGYSLNPRYEYKYLHTPMDYLQRIIGQYCYESKRGQSVKPIPLHAIVKTIGEGSLYGRHYKKRAEIVGELRNHRWNLSKVFVNHYVPSERLFAARVAKRFLDDYIESVDVGERVSYLLLRAMDDEEFKDVRKLIFAILFNSSNQSLFDVLEKNKEAISVLEEHESGDISLHGYNFREKTRKSAENTF